MFPKRRGSVPCLRSCVQTRTKKEEASLWEGTVVKKSTLHFSFLQGAAAEDASRSTTILLLVGATVTDGYMEEALAASFVFSPDSCCLLRSVGN